MPKQPPFRRALLPALVEFICRHWHHEQFLTNVRLEQK